MVESRHLGAIAAEQFYLHGSGAFATDVISAADADDLVKGGVKGVYVGILLALGLGVALKIDDGTRRADDIDASPVAGSNQLGRT